LAKNLKRGGGKEFENNDGENRIFSERTRLALFCWGSLRNSGKTDEPRGGAAKIWRGKNPSKTGKNITSARSKRLEKEKKKVQKENTGPKKHTEKRPRAKVKARKLQENPKPMGDATGKIGRQDEKNSKVE